MNSNKYLNDKTNQLIKIISLFSLLTIITFINDKYIRTYFSAYSNQLRLIDHFLAGLCIPMISYCALGEFYKKCKFYFVWSTYWEVSQYVSRGYFQYLQYTFDLLGIAIAICIYKNISIIKKTIVNIKQKG